MGIKLTKEEALAYVRKIEDENRVLKNRCYVLSGGSLCSASMTASIKKGNRNDSRDMSVLHHGFRWLCTAD